MREFGKFREEFWLIITDLGEMMGHSSTATTKIYTGYLPAKNKKWFCKPVKNKKKYFIFILYAQRIILNLYKYNTGGNQMSKVVTLRLSDEEYNLYAKAAKVVKRPISNLINYLAQQKLEEDIFVDQIEMDEIFGNKFLIKSLKQGSKDAKLKKGTFVDV